MSDVRWRRHQTARVAAAMAVFFAVIASACIGHVEGTPPGQATPTPTPTPTAHPDQTARVGCVNPPPDVLALIDQTDPVACYSTAALTVAAFVTGLGAVDCPGGLKPAWFSCEVMIQLEPPRDVAEAPVQLAARSTRPATFAVLDPGSGLNRDDLLEANWLVTGHYDDLAAQACRYSAWPVGAGAPPPAAEVIGSCRRTLVMTSVAPRS